MAEENEDLTRKIPLQRGNFKDFHTCDGETVYRSKGTGIYCMQFQGFFKNQEIDRLETGFYADADIRVKKIKKCFVTNNNLIITSNGELLAQYGYHLFTVPTNPLKYGIKNKIDRVIRTGQVGDFLVSDSVTIKKNGFYVGNTDNFGHWLFEFLPRVLWYKRLFPNQEIPLLIGEMVPNKWLEFLAPLGVDSSNVERFESYSTIKYEELIVCSASCSRLPSGEPSLRLQDFFELRGLVSDYFKHISYDLKRLDCLFCTRKNARWRKTVNEDEAIEWLSSRFETKVFEPENLSIKQQLELLGKAKFFFGAGASIPMTMFSPHDSVLFEIRPPQGHGVVGRCWADMFRFGYHRVAVDVHGQEGQKREKTMSAKFHEKDLIIDMDKFKKDVSEIAKMTEF